MSAAQSQEIYERLTKTVKAVLYAMVVVPLAQGLLAMLGFNIFGLPSPLFWGTMLIFAAIIPGSAHHWFGFPPPYTSLLPHLCGKGSGCFSTARSSSVRPTTSSNRCSFTKPPRSIPSLAFFSILGGILSFGLIGFLVGPVILSLMLSAIRIYRMDILRAPSEKSVPATAPPAQAPAQ